MTPKVAGDANGIPQEFWSLPAPELSKRLETTPGGLSSQEARQRLSRFGLNRLRPRKKTGGLALFLSQFSTPIIIILIAAAVLALILRDSSNALIILSIVFASGLLGFLQERGATRAVDALLAIVQVKATAVRDGNPTEVSIEEIVPGDVVVLGAGSMIPGDCLILESRDLFVDEATLTGETFPAEKSAGVVPPETRLDKRVNTLFMGTHVVSGTCKALVIRTGRDTEFGKVSERVRLRPPETEFEQGVRRFGYLLTEVTLILTIGIFAVNVYFARPILDSFMFSLALAVGLTPQLLPAIISVNLAHGAKRMALKKVIVKRLASIEDFGSMNVLCSDKTGTLTEGRINLESTVDYEGNESDKTFLLAYVNSLFETGFENPIDEAIRTHAKPDVSGFSKLDEVPYDFVRKRLTVLVSRGDTRLMITKGAVENVLAVCSFAENHAGETVSLSSIMEHVHQHFEKLSRSGFRTLGVAYKNADSSSVIARENETGMTFLGFLVFLDPPKPGVADVVAQLEKLGVSLKLVTGDNPLVAVNIATKVGLATAGVITGPELHAMSDEALLRRVNAVDVFAEVEPNQKERIILALKKAGNVVGYMGDGINDASALHVADIGISVDAAADSAKEAAPVVLLEKDFGVLVEGVLEGRRTFANTLKYVFMATSANFGNMFSMAGASLFLAFLPLLPKQVLLTNLLTDFPEMAIASDCVDHELVEKPRRWDMKFIRRFMIVFGLLSSVFDYLTFGALLLVMHAGMKEFRTGWFLESVVSAALVVLVVRTRRPFFRSLPGRGLLTATLAIVAVTLVLPFTPLAPLFGFVTLPVRYLAMMAVIVLLYVLAAEGTKRAFYRKARA